MQPVDQRIKEQLDIGINAIGEILDADALSIYSPITYGLDNRVQEALIRMERNSNILVILHDTPGGVVEIIERMVESIRNYYQEVIIIIPDRAMSAGTIFALSADRILMNNFSVLGPIDPQVEKDGKLVPALSYLIQYERLNQKAANGQLTSAEYALIQKFDLGELHQFEQARELSKELLIKWLSKYKFKNWSQTETTNKPVTKQMKEIRATQIADILNDPERWHSHARSIHINTLVSEIGLKIENFEDIPNLATEIQNYTNLLTDYMRMTNLHSFVHARGFF